MDLNGESFMCRCGDAIRVYQDGTRITLYDHSPHLNHDAYVPWMERHGFTPESLGWLAEVVDYPPSIRDQIVSPRLLWRCGLLPGIDWSAFPEWSGRLMTTTGQQPHHSHYADVAPETEGPPGRPDVADTAPEDPPEPTDTAEPVHQPSVATRFGGPQTTTTPGRSAADRWS